MAGDCCGDVKFDGDKDAIIKLGEEMDALYIEKVVQQSINPELIAANPDIKIVYTPIHGTGVEMVPRALKRIGFTNIYNVPEQDVVDGNFPTVVSPNPEESAALDRRQAQPLRQHWPCWGRPLHRCCRPDHIADSGRPRPLHLLL